MFDLIARHIYDMPRMFEYMPNDWIFKFAIICWLNIIPSGVAMWNKRFSKTFAYQFTRINMWICAYFAPLAIWGDYNLGGWRYWFIFVLAVFGGFVYYYACKEVLRWLGKLNEKIIGM